MPPLIFLTSKASITGGNGAIELPPGYFPDAPYVFVSVGVGEARSSNDGLTWDLLQTNAGLTSYVDVPWGGIDTDGTQIGVGEADNTGGVTQPSFFSSTDPLWSSWNVTREPSTGGSPPVEGTWAEMRALTHNPVHNIWYAARGIAGGSGEDAYLDDSVDLPGRGQWVEQTHPTIPSPSGGSTNIISTICTNKNPDSLLYGEMVGASRIDYAHFTRDGGATWDAVVTNAANWNPSIPYVVVSTPIVHHQITDTYIIGGRFEIWALNTLGRSGERIASLPGGFTDDPRDIDVNQNTGTVIVGIRVSSNTGRVVRLTNTGSGWSSQFINLPGTANLLPALVTAVHYSPTLDRWIALGGGLLWYSDSDGLAGSWVNAGLAPISALNHIIAIK